MYSSTKKMGRYEEIISNFAEIIQEHIAIYQRSLKTAPEHIVIYRDGVSEGMYDRVLQKELNKLQELIKTDFPNPPKLTFMIVTKRID